MQSATFSLSTPDSCLSTFFAVFAALLTVILFAFSTICSHRSAKLIGGTEANFWRVTGATLLLGLWSYSFGVGMEGVAFPWFLISGMLGIGLGDVAWFQALPRLGPRVSVLVVQCLSAPFGALVEWLWLGTRLSWHQVFWGLLIVSGLGIALKPGEHLNWRRGAVQFGLLMCIFASLGTATGAVVSRKAYQVTTEAGESIDGFNAGFQRVAGGVIISGIFLLIAKRQVWRVQHSAPRELVTAAAIHKWKGAWYWVFLNALAGQTLGVSCMQWALEKAPTGIVLAIISTTPLVVMPLAFIFEGERPTPRSIIGGVVGVAGVVGLTLSK